ncbi:hypothetical protein ACFXC8_00290 [Streptomyces sp. NPDC059441]|uniref:hypothetical protein n=1 Tax=Streptomyces sp. NPDC059441 TaxID=3346829 RepID=UPI00367ED805
MDEQLDLAWIDDEDWDHPDPDPRLHDLRGQGLTPRQLNTIVDVPIRERYL